MKAEEIRQQLFDEYNEKRIERTNAIMARYLDDEISKDEARQEMRDMRQVLLLKLAKDIGG